MSSSGREVIPLTLALVGGAGVHWAYTAAVLGRRGFRAPAPRTGRHDFAEWLRQAGLDGVAPREFTAAVAVFAVMAFLLTHAAFGGVAPAVMAGVFGASFPFASYRHRRHLRRARAQEAWPRMIEEIRVQTTSLGRSIPHALFEVGARGPEELRPAFAAAQREWLLTTDLQRTLQVLKDRLVDPTADMTCETLLVAHEIGGTDLDKRLEALADDRLQDVQDRKDARSRQAGARFARVFVLLVPAGMAVAGTSIGNGRQAYQSANGRIVVPIAIALVIGCWAWAGRVMRLPDTDRVFMD
jgi:tight adherence protein B